MLDDDIAAYAAAIGLETFVLDAPVPAEYSAQSSAAEKVYRNTGRLVLTAMERNSRPRIKAPFRWFGHVVCTQPHSIEGIYWCLDLLRAGYVVAHVPTAHGPRRVALPWQLTRNVLERLGWRHRRVAARLVLERLSQHRACSYQPEPGRILMLATDLGRGGTERRMLITASGLVQRGYGVRLITLGTSAAGAPTFDEEIRKLGIVPQALTDFAVAPPAADLRWSNDGHSSADMSELPQWLADLIPQVAGAIRIYRPCVVHSWLDKPGLAGALAAARLGVPRIVISFGSLPLTHYNEQVPVILQLGYRAVARNPNVTLLNNSAAGAAGYERWIGLRRGSIRVVRNAFLRDHMPRPPVDEVARFRASLGVTSGKPLVGAVMRLSREKDPALWLATVAEIVKVRPDVVFGLCGYGPLQDETARQVEALGLRGRVRLAGPIADLGLAYAAFDVVLLTSMVEGLPNMLIEAQAAGCPVVTTDVGGAREAVAEGVTGIVVRERSARELAHAVLTILADPSWRERAQMQGPAFVDRNFGFKRMIDETIEVYGTERRPPP